MCVGLLASFTIFLELFVFTKFKKRHKNSVLVSAVPLTLRVYDDVMLYSFYLLRFEFLLYLSISLFLNVTFQLVNE